MRGSFHIDVSPSVFCNRLYCTLKQCKSEQGLYFGGSCQMFVFMTLDYTLVLFSLMKTSFLHNVFL